MATYILRGKDWDKKDKYSFLEYVIYRCEYTGVVLNPPNIGWERLKYAEEFDSYEVAYSTKKLVDPFDQLLDVVELNVAWEDYHRD